MFPPLLRIGYASHLLVNVRYIDLANPFAFPNISPSFKRIIPFGEEYTQKRMQTSQHPLALHAPSHIPNLDWDVGRGLGRVNLFASYQFFFEINLFLGGNIILSFPASVSLLSPHSESGVQGQILIRSRGEVGHCCRAS